MTVDDFKFDIFEVLFITFLFSCMGFGIGMELGRQGDYAEAIKAGVGQYVTDPETGSTTFVFGRVK